MHRRRRHQETDADHGHWRHSHPASQRLFDQYEYGEKISANRCRAAAVSRIGLLRIAAANSRTTVVMGPVVRYDHQRDPGLARAVQTRFYRMPQTRSRPVYVRRRDHSCLREDWVTSCGPAAPARQCAGDPRRPTSCRSTRPGPEWRRLFFERFCARPPVTAALVAGDRCSRRCPARAPTVDDAPGPSAPQTPGSPYRTVPWAVPTPPRSRAGGTCAPSACG